MVGDNLKKNILYITNYLDDNTTIGYRHSNILKHISLLYNIDIMNFGNLDFHNSLFKRFMNKLMIYPDIQYFNIIKYKNKLKIKLKDKQYDYIIIAILPFSFLSLITFTKKKQPNAKIIVDMSDPLTANVSYIKDNLFHKSFIRFYEKINFKNIDTLIVLNEEIKEYYKSKYLFLKNIIIIEQGVEKESLLNNKLNLTKLDMLYAGVFYKKIREPYKLYEAVERYPNDIKLSIYGNFKKEFLPPKSERFIYGGSVSRDIINKTIIETKIIVFIDNFVGIQIPGKIIEVLATNKPILFIYENENSPTLKYVRRYEGVFYSKNDSNEIITQIDSINKQNLIDYNRDISNYFWENIVKHLIILIN